MFQEQSDLELVARCVAARDSAAYGELVKRHQSQVRGFLRKLTRDIEYADDLAQDCFLHAWRKIQTYSGRGSFIGWLLKIAYTTFLQSARKTKRYDEVLGEVGQQRTAVGAHVTVDSDEVADLDKFLAVLGEDERAVLLLSYAHGLSHREISTATGLPVGTVKSIIFRSKEKIRERFDIEDHQYG